MKLGEFIEQFSHNNLVRLLYKTKGGNKLVLDSWEDVSMDWEINKGKGVFRHYINNEVVGLMSIFIEKGNYTEAINIIIEELDDQPIIEEVKSEISHTESSDD